MVDPLDNQLSSQVELESGTIVLIQFVCLLVLANFADNF
jgi:hypothetical protein